MTETRIGTMRALAKTAPAPGAELVERPIPAPGPGEVLLKMEAASICGTDHHLFTWDDWAAENLVPPRILGHELAGRVARAGAGVTRVREGDLVGVESHIVDWTCSQCRAGMEHLCRNLRVIGVHVDGGFAEYVAIPEANAIESKLSFQPWLSRPRSVERWYSTKPSPSRSPYTSIQLIARSTAGTSSRSFSIGTPHRSAWPTSMTNRGVESIDP